MIGLLEKYVSLIKLKKTLVFQQQKNPKLVLPIEKQQ
jgi:hypothetical protein